MIIDVTMINAWKGDVNEFSSVKVNLIPVERNIPGHCSAIC